MIKGYWLVEQNLFNMWNLRNCWRENYIGTEASCRFLVPGSWKIFIKATFTLKSKVYPPVLGFWYIHIPTAHVF